MYSYLRDTTLAHLSVMPSTTNVILYAYDGNGNVTGLIDAYGDEVGHYDYDPFGNTVAMSGSMSKSNPFRFSTKYFEVPWNLYYYGYRYYSPEVGRWLSRDPIDEQGGANLYGFVGNEPIGSWDDLGLACSWAVGRCMNVLIVGGYIPSTITIGGRTFTVPARLRSLAQRLLSPFSHHDVKIAAYSGANCTGGEEESTVRGFFPLNGRLDAVLNWVESQIPFAGVSGWVPGTASAGSPSAGSCSLSCVSKERYNEVKGRITAATAHQFHLTQYNCQTWAADALR